jgi:hypothetical protein
MIKFSKSFKNFKVFIKFQNQSKIEPYVIKQLLHQHGTAQITSDIPQTSLHKHWTITQNTADTPQTSLHKHGRIRQITLDKCLCNEV